MRGSVWKSRGLGEPDRKTAPASQLERRLVAILELPKAKGEEILHVVDGLINQAS